MIFTSVKLIRGKIYAMTELGDIYMVERDPAMGVLIQRVRTGQQSWPREFTDG